MKAALSFFFGFVLLMVYKIKAYAVQVVKLQQQQQNISVWYIHEVYEKCILKLCIDLLVFVQYQLKLACYNISE